MNLPGMLQREPGLTLAIAHLLPPVTLDRRAVSMPDERRRGEPDSPAARLQSPAHIDVVAGAQVDRVESTDLKQRVAAKRHVASGHVLGDAIVEQDVRWSARRPSHALRDPGVVGRADIGTAGADHVGRDKRLNQVGQPQRIDPHVGVGIGDDGAGRVRQAEVAGVTEPAVRDVDDPSIDQRIVTGPLRRRPRVGEVAGAIGRSVVDDDDLEVGVVERVERGQAFADRVGGVVSANDHRDPRPGGPGVGAEGRVRKRLSDRVERRFRLTFAIDQSEIPILDLDCRRATIRRSRRRPPRHMRPLRRRRECACW